MNSTPMYKHELSFAKPLKKNKNRRIWSAIIACILILVWMISTPIKTEISIKGWIVAENKFVQIGHPYDGTIKTVFVQSGDKIHKGERLINYENNHLIVEIKQQQNELIKILLKFELAKGSIEQTLDLDFPKLVANAIKYPLLKKNIADDLEELIREEGKLGELKQELLSLYPIIGLHKKLSELQTEIKKYTRIKNIIHYEIKLIDNSVSHFNELNTDIDRLKELIRLDHDKYNRIQSEIHKIEFRSSFKNITNSIKFLDEINQHINHLESTKQRLTRLNFVSPVSGSITHLKAEKNQNVRSGEIFLTIENPIHYYVVKTSLTKKMRHSVKVGDPVEISLNDTGSHKKNTLTGMISKISKVPKVIDKDGTQYFNTVINLNKNNIALNRNFSIKEGLLVNTRIYSNQKNILEYLISNVFN